MRRVRKKAPSLNLLRSAIFILLIFVVLVIFVTNLGSWDGKSRFTVIVQNIGSGNNENYNLAVFSVGPNNQQGNYVLVSNDFMLEIPYGYKTYPVYSVYKLGELDKARGGGKLLKKSIETTLGIKSDRYLLFKSESAAKLPESRPQFSEFRRKNFSFIFGLQYLRLIFTSTESDMSVIEKLRFFLAVRNLYESRLNFINLAETNASVPVRLADGTDVKNVDTDTFDYLITANFQDLNVRQEGLTLEVQNATGQEKIAKQFSRILEHLGADVIFISTASDEAMIACQLIYNNKKVMHSEIVKILKKDYHCIEGKAREDTMQSDILVIIGHDFLK